MEMRVVPPWIFPICCVHGVEHYLVVPLNTNGMKQTLWPRIGISREIIKCELMRTHVDAKVLNEHHSLNLQYAIFDQ